MFKLEFMFSPLCDQVTYKDLDKGNRIMESDIKRYVQLKYLKNLDRKLIKTESNYIAFFSH